MSKYKTGRYCEQISETESKQIEEKQYERAGEVFEEKERKRVKLARGQVTAGSVSLAGSSTSRSSTSSSSSALSLESRPSASSSVLGASALSNEERGYDSDDTTELFESYIDPLASSYESDTSVDTVELFAAAEGKNKRKNTHNYKSEETKESHRKSMARIHKNNNDARSGGLSLAQVVHSVCKNSTNLVKIENKDTSNMTCKDVARFRGVDMNGFSLYTTNADILAILMGCETDALWSTLRRLGFVLLDTLPGGRNEPFTGNMNSSLGRKLVAQKKMHFDHETFCHSMSDTDLKAIVRLTKDELDQVSRSSVTEIEWRSDEDWNDPERWPYFRNGKGAVTGYKVCRAVGCLGMQRGPRYFNCCRTHSYAYKKTLKSDSGSESDSDSGSESE